MKKEFSLTYNGVTKVFGGHSYPDSPSGIGYCRHGCGCRKGPESYEFPAGIDPKGACPGKYLSGPVQMSPPSIEIEFVVNARIQMAESEIASQKETIERLRGNMKAMNTLFGR